MAGAAPAFELIRPSGPEAPVLFDSPHSGREYPADFGAAAPLAELRRGEDAYVDELVRDAASQGVTVLLATFPRCYLDLNRTEEDIDADLLADPWPGSLVPTEKSRLGLGLIRRYVVPGVAVYDRKLTAAEVRDRITRVYRPYHAALRDAAESLLTRHGRVWHVNWHSMKAVGNAMTPDGEGARRPDFVVGDLRGLSAGVELTDLVVNLLRGMGYVVAVNQPYAGGTILRRLGDPARGVHSIQIEINRGLYLDELRVEKTAGMAPLAAAIRSLTGSLVEAVSGAPGEGA
jgi:N-formylglutamate deformylase